MNHEDAADATPNEDSEDRFGAMQAAREEVADSEVSVVPKFLQNLLNNRIHAFDRKQDGPLCDVLDGPACVLSDINGQFSREFEQMPSLRQPRDPDGNGQWRWHGELIGQTPRASNQDSVRKPIFEGALANYAVSCGDNHLRLLMDINELDTLRSQ
jgi:hypothetical protein